MTVTFRDASGRLGSPALLRGRRAVLVTTDLLGLPAALAEPICQRITEKTGLKREQILLTSAHTHNGPVLSLDPTASDNGMSPGDVQRTIAYTKRLQDQIVQVVIDANQKLEPANLSWGGGVVLGANPRGLADRTVPVLRIDGADGKPRAVLFGAVVHNTTLRPQHYELCGDYAGFAQRYVQEQHAGVQAMFVVGCAGDADPYPHGSMELAREHGASLGKEVCRVLTTKLTPVTGSLKTALKQVDLPLQQPPARAELEKQAAAKRGVSAWVAQQMLKTLARGDKLPTTAANPPRSGGLLGS